MCMVFRTYSYCSGSTGSMLSLALVVLVRTNSITITNSMTAHATTVITNMETDIPTARGIAFESSEILGLAVTTGVKETVDE